MAYVRNYPAHTLDGTYLVHIVAVETPWRIYAYRVDEAVDRESFLLEICDRDQSELHHLLEEEIFCGSLVLVNNGGQLFRGVVKAYTSNTNNIEVWLGDYAIGVTVSLDELFVMPSSDRAVQWKVFACGLGDVQPVEGPEWPADTCAALQESLNDRDVWMRTTCPDATWEAIWMDLITVNDQGATVLYTDQMVNSGHARPLLGLQGFDWGDGAGSFSDQRRASYLDHKRACQRARRIYTSMCEGRVEEAAPPASETSAVPVSNGATAVDPPVWYGDDYEVDTRQNSVPRRECLNSCGESEVDSETD